MLRVTRSDFAGNNALAHQTWERFGELPLEGTRGSEFAPPIILHWASDGVPGVGGSAELSSVLVDGDVGEMVLESLEGSGVRFTRS